MDTDVAPVTLQFRVEDCPWSMVAGDAENKAMIGTPGPGGLPPVFTVTVVCEVTEPAELVAVRMYVVVAAGDTLVVPAAATVPMELIDTEVAPVTLQLRAELPPVLMVAGEAAKKATIGTPAAGFTVTVTCAVVVPMALIAVST
jgi:hypothetical protein